MKARLKLVVLVLLCAQATSVYAIDLMSGLINAGVNAVGNIGSAVVNKITEDSPEQAAAKRQKTENEQAAAYKKSLAEIEAKTDWTPLQKEHVKLSLDNMYKKTVSYQAGQEARDNAARKAKDQAVSGSGIIGAIGGALISGANAATASNNPYNMSNSQLIARGNGIVRATQPGIDIAAAQANSMQNANSTSPLPLTNVNANPGSQQARLMQATNDGVQAALTSNAASVSHLVAAANASTPEQQGAVMDSVRKQTGIAAMLAQQRTAATKEVNYAIVQTAPAPFLFSQDKGRKVYFEFAGSRSLTTSIHTSMSAAGYNVVSKAADAEVQYQFQGDYIITETPNHEALVSDAGAIFDGKAIQPPTKKSAWKNSARSFLGTMAGIKAPEQNDEAYKQQVLVVVNRHADGKDLRASSYVEGQSMDIQAAGMVKMALADLFTKTGE